MMDSIKVSARTLKRSAGIYEVGEGCYVRMFITDSGWCLPVNHRMITEEDLLDVYEQGLRDAGGLKMDNYEGDEYEYDLDSLTGQAPSSAGRDPVESEPEQPKHSE